MKVSDYIIEFLISKGVTDIFGYPGGSINHLIDSASKYSEITAHDNYNEQGSSFAACGYAQASHKLGVAFSTSGPGATNLVTGIAGAYFDSVPTLFITGNVDTPAEKGDLPIRQRGFQETDMVAVTKSISKWAHHVKSIDEIRYDLEKAFYIAFEGNPGPVVLDIPNDIQRAEFEGELKGFSVPESEHVNKVSSSDIDKVLDSIKEAKQPVFLFGNAAKTYGAEGLVQIIVETLNVPAIFSMPANDTLPYNHSQNYGFIGTNGYRYANMLTLKADLIVAIGTRMDIRQIGLNREQFAPEAKLVRVEIDQTQVDYKVKQNELVLHYNLVPFLEELVKKAKSLDIKASAEWNDKCRYIKKKLQGIDDEFFNNVIKRISHITHLCPVKERPNAAADVGQNLLWTYRSFNVIEGQQIYASTGNAPMGYSLPAAIGVTLATHRPVISFCGDGGLMMNVQEMQFVKREHLPIKIVVLNNRSLGMIRSWQKRYLGKCSLTTADSGFLSPNVELIAKAFDFKYSSVKAIEDIECIDWSDHKPEVIEVFLDDQTETKPLNNMKDQTPQVDRDIYNELLNL